MHTNGMAYLLWLPGLFLVCGVHRFYCGRPITGLVWLFTFGLLGVGQLLDLLLIPGMVERANWRSGMGGNRNTNTNIINVHVGGQGRGRGRRGRDDFDFEE
jgi:TM2 domain-containing membrane protein YozV